MFSLRSSKSDRSLRKLKKPRFHHSSPPLPEVDFVAFRNTLPVSPVPPSSLPPVTPRHTRPADRPLCRQAPTATRRSRCISNRSSRRDTILIDLTKNDDLIPALDYAFAILDESLSGSPSSSSSVSPSPTPNTSNTRSSSASSDLPSPPMPSTPLSFSCRPPSPFVSPSLSVRSAPPRYHHVATLPAIEDARPLMVMSQPHRDVLFSPPPLSSSSSHVRALSTDSVSPPPSLPFPPSPECSPIRVPLLQRKPRILHSPESSIDGHDPFIASYPNMSKASLVRSPSSLDHRKDPFYYPGACPSSASVNTMDSQLAQLLAGQTTPRSSSSSLKIFPSPKTARRVLIRRASTPHSVRNTRHLDRFKTIVGV